MQTECRMEQNGSDCLQTLYDIIEKLNMFEIIVVRSLWLDRTRFNKIRWEIDQNRIVGMTLNWKCPQWSNFRRVWHNLETYCILSVIIFYIQPTGNEYPDFGFWFLANFLVLGYCTIDRVTYSYRLSNGGQNYKKCWPKCDLSFSQQPLRVYFFVIKRKRQKFIELPFLELSLSDPHSLWYNRSKYDLLSING